MTDPALLPCGVCFWEKVGQAQSRLLAVGFPALFPARKGQTRCLTLLVQPASQSDGPQLLLGDGVET